LKTYKFVVNVELVDDGIPYGVELACTIVILEREIVAAAVSSGEIVVNSAQRVHGLVNITQVVDEEAEGI